MFLLLVNNGYIRYAADFNSAYFNLLDNNDENRFDKMQMRYIDIVNISYLKGNIDKDDLTKAAFSQASYQLETQKLDIYFHADLVKLTFSRPAWEYKEIENEKF